MTYTTDDLADLEEIKTLSAIYARGLDRFNTTEIMQVFSEDAVFDATAASMDVYTGTSAIEEFFLHNQEVMYDQIHLFGNFVIELDGPDKAHGTSYLFQDGHTKSGDRVTTSCLNEDTYEKRSGEWFVVRRACIPLMPLVGNDDYQK